MFIHDKLMYVMKYVRLRKIIIWNMKFVIVILSIKAEKIFNLINYMNWDIIMKKNDIFFFKTFYNK